MKYAIPENAIIKSINLGFAEKHIGDRMEGLLIETDKGSIKLLIDDEPQCCENFGSTFLDTPDNIEKFIGSAILSVEDICTSSYSEEANETQLKIITSKGVLQFAVYNEHNGYYSHATFTQVFDTVERDSV